MTVRDISSVPPVPSLPAVTFAVAKPPAARSAPRRVWRVLEFVVLALLVPLVPLALGVGLFWSRLDSMRSWQREYQVAAVLTSGIALVAILLAVLAWRAKRLLVAHLITPLALVTLTILMFTSAAPAGLAQGRAYDQDRAYALAITTLRAAGAPKAELANIQMEWARAAVVFQDLGAESQHFRAALALGLSTVSARDTRETLTQLTVQWGTELTQARQYGPAVRVYADQLADTSCDSPCQQALQAARGQTYLAWAGDLIVTGHIADAMTTLQTLIRQQPTSASATTAKHVLANQNASLSTALAIGKAGDLTGMTLLLKLLAVRHPGTLEAAEAAAAAQPVTGTLLN
ncbi:MAG: hypothetical protein IVW57_19255, partial [Ktedonobacterales bacterium]|nr:hypothetical protein [Ktedonobacterales bacterium]